MVCAALIIVAVSVVLLVVGYVGRHEWTADRVRYAITLGLAYVIPVSLAWLGIRRDHPSDTIAAGAVLSLIGLVSVVLCPLTIIALIMTVSASRYVERAPDRLRNGLVAAVIIVAPVGSIISLLANQEWVEVRTASGSRGGEQTTMTGYLMAWAFLALLASTAFVRPSRTRDRVDPVRPDPQPAHLPG